jgi:hypothetical protein
MVQSCKKENVPIRNASLNLVNINLNPDQVIYNPELGKFIAVDINGLDNDGFYYPRAFLLNPSFEQESMWDLFSNMESRLLLSYIVSSHSIWLPGKGTLTGITQEGPAMTANTITLLKSNLQRILVDSFYNYYINEIKTTADGGFIILCGSKTAIDHHAQIRKYNSSLQLEKIIDIPLSIVGLGSEIAALGICETFTGEFMIGGVYQPLAQKFQTYNIGYFTYTIDLSGTIIKGPFTFPFNKVPPDNNDIPYLDRVKVFHLPNGNNVLVYEAFNDLNSSFDICVKTLAGNGTTISTGWYGGACNQWLSEAYVLPDGDLVFLARSDRYLKQTELVYGRVNLQDNKSVYFHSISNVADAAFATSTYFGASPSLCIYGNSMIVTNTSTYLSGGKQRWFLMKYTIDASTGNLSP